VLILWKQLTEL